MYVSDLIIYPLKSSKPISVDQSTLTDLGLEFDRIFGLFDQDLKILTAREYPQILDISCDINASGVTFKLKDEVIGQCSLQSSSASTAVHIHSYSGYAQRVSAQLDIWFSNYLDTLCQLMIFDATKKRPVLAKHGGQENDVVSFSDQSPLLLISNPSVADLNTRLNEKIKVDRFRANIVIDDCAPFEEDSWEIIKIGSVKLRVIHQCERCVLTTIDPITKLKHHMMEPLRTLAKYRKGPNGGVVLGVRAVPIENGQIRKGDKLEVIKSVERPVGS